MTRAPKQAGSMALLTIAKILELPPCDHHQPKPYHGPTASDSTLTKRTLHQSRSAQVLQEAVFARGGVYAIPLRRERETLPRRYSRDSHSRSGSSSFQRWDIVYPSTSWGSDYVILPSCATPSSLPLGSASTGSAPPRSQSMWPSLPAWWSIFPSGCRT